MEILLSKNSKLEIRNARVLAKPKLLLHTCCAPCLTAVYEKLCHDFDLAVYWYNPNIFPLAEHDKRLDEVKKLSRILKFKLIIDPQSKNNHKKWRVYKQQLSNRTIKQSPLEPEGGRRCWLCYQFRLEKVARYASDQGFDYFTTTFTVSPYKNALKIFEIGKFLEQQKKVKFLAQDFKKLGGYHRSIELSKKYGLYRQNYCGCEYSIRTGQSKNS